MTDNRLTPIALARATSLATIAVTILACVPTGAGDVVAGGLTPIVDHEADDESDDESTDDGDGDGDDDPPLLDLGGEPFGDGDGEVPECDDHFDCEALSSACSIGVCGPGGQCESIAANDGDTCASDDLCTIGSTCFDGECLGGSPLDCSDLDGACITGVCDPQSGACESTPIDGCELGLPDDPDPEPEPEPEPDPEPDPDACPIGSDQCPCTGGGGCDPGLACGDAWTCLTPGELCADLITPVVTYGELEIVAVQLDGAMSDQNIAAACSTCGMAPLCGSVPNPFGCAPGWTETWNGPSYRCCQPCPENPGGCTQCTTGDLKQYDDGCTQLPATPETKGGTSHAALAQALGCANPLVCPAMLATWVYAAGANQHWEPDGQGGYVWIDDGPVGIELFTGWMNPPNCVFGNCPHSDNEPQWVDGYGHSKPNPNAYHDRKALCISP